MCLSVVVCEYLQGSVIQTHHILMGFKVLCCFLFMTN
uniref:Uncharacterized protein n=1 Tax=Rhizophora mucronata TaxID=61149 RepID=A0A2P2QBG3_RHIMU